MTEIVRGFAVLTGAGALLLGWGLLLLGVAVMFATSPGAGLLLIVVGWLESRLGRYTFNRGVRRP